MRVLVTGAAGFVGCQVARILLEQGCEVHATIRETTDPWRIRDLPDLRIATLDLRCRESVGAYVRSIRPQNCYHFAWSDGKDLNAFDNADDLRPSIDLAAAVAEAGCERFVGIGTVHEYEAGGGKLSETSPLRPQNLQAATKTAFATALRRIERCTQMKHTWVRPFFHYGPYEQPRRLIRFVIEALRDGRPARTTSGEQIVDYLHVEDAGAAICAAAESGLPVVNICSGNPVAVRDVVRRIGELMDAVELLEIGAIPRRLHDPPYLCGDNQLLRTRTSWTPRFDLETGLRHTIDWFTNAVA